MRIEIGPKDVAKNSVMLARRDKPGREGKSSVPQEGSRGCGDARCTKFSRRCMTEALAFRKSQTDDPKDYVEFKKAVEKGFAFSFWCGSSDCEAKIKEETKATMRCIPLEQPGGIGGVYLLREDVERSGHTSRRRTEQNCWRTSEERIQATRP